MDVENLITLFSALAGICMAICQVPQVLSIYRTKKTDGVSVWMQIILSFGVMFWFLVGVLLDNAPMYISNGCCMLCCVYVLLMCLKNKRRQ